MGVITHEQALRGEVDEEGSYFTGRVSSFDLFIVESPMHVNVGLTRYYAGSRNYWHSHSGGQLLYIVEGEGFIQSQGGPPQRIRQGDSVSAAPGEVHWHGAGRSAHMVHLSVTVGEHSWLGESPEPETG